MTFLNFLVILAAIVNISLTVIILKNDYKSPINRSFAFALISIVGWSTALLLSIYSGERFPTRMITVFGILTANRLFEFISIYPDNKVFSKKLIIFSNIVSVIFYIIAWIPSTVVRSVSAGSGHMSYQAGPFTLSLAMVLYGYLIVGGYILILKTLRFKGVEKNQILILMLGLLPFGFIGITTDLILPSMNIHQFNGMGPVASIFVAISSAIAIIRYRALKIRLIIIETFVYIFLLYLTVELIFSSSLNILFSRLVFFGIASYGGYLMIRSMYKEIHQNEELQELDKRKSNFLADIAHKLKTPLTITRMNIDLAKKEIEANNLKQAKESAIHSMQSVDKLARLCTNLITLGKIDFGISKLNKTEIDFSQLVKSSTNDFKVILGDRKLIITIEPNISIIGDSDRLQEMILNLLDNSVKFTDPDRGKISVSLSVIPEKSGIQDLDSRLHGNDKRRGGNGKQDSIENGLGSGSQIRSLNPNLTSIVLTIKDNGIGIDEAVLPNLFSRYYQVESRSGSAGIGLSIVKWIVEGHGGKIEIKSKKGEGTAFRIVFGKQ